MKIKKFLNGAWKTLALVFALFCLICGVIGFRENLWILIIYGILLGGVIILWNRFPDKKNGKKVCKPWRIIRAVLAVFVCAITLLELGMFTAGAIIARDDDCDGKEVTVLVLGADVDGDQPGSSLKARLDKALEYLERNPDAPVVVSGLGSSEIPEAEVMANYLIAQGIAPEQIYQENQALSTPENFSYSLQVIEENHLPQDVVVVTNDFHQFRASLYARQAGLTAYQQSAPTALWLFFPISIREHYIIIVDEWLGGNVDLVNKYHRI